MPCRTQRMSLVRVLSSIQATCGVPFLRISNMNRKLEPRALHMKVHVCLHYVMGLVLRVFLVYIPDEAGTIIAVVGLPALPVGTHICQL